MMEQRLTILTLGVNDLDVSSDFYVNKIGWTRTDDSNENIIFFKLNGLLLSIYPREKLAEDATVNPEGNGFKSFTLAWNARSEQEVDDVFNKLKKAGVRIVKPPEHVFWGGYSGYIADPDGHLWEIAYNPYLAMDEHGNI